MNFRTRTLVTLGGTSLVLVVVLYVAVALVIGRQFSEVEDQQGVDLALRARDAILEQVDGTCAKARDWAAWDDSWQFAQDNNEDYRTANLKTPSWSALNLDGILVFGATGQLVDGVARTAEGTGAVPAALLTEHFSPRSPTITGLGIGEEHGGVLFSRGLPPIAFCALPTLHTDGTGPITGTFVMLRYLDEARIGEIARKARLGLSVVSPPEETWTSDLTARARRLDDADAVELDRVSDEVLMAWFRIDEFGSDRPLVARASLDRPVFAQSRRSLAFTLGALLAFGLVFVAFIMAMVERFVLPSLRRKLERIDHGTRDLAATASQSAATAASEASMVAQVSTTVEEIYQTSRSSADNAREALTAASEALRINGEAKASMAEAMQVIQVIEQVATIVDSVNELQEQSNLLAVNAGIVAAKSGEQGRGFAVVAGELRELAERSKGATRRIRDVILRTDHGRRAIEEADEVIRKLGRVLEQAASQIREIVEATQQQAAGVQQINEAMGAVAQGGQETSAGSCQIEQAVASLEQLGAELGRFVGRRLAHVPAENPPPEERGSGRQEEMEEAS